MIRKAILALALAAPAAMVGAPVHAQATEPFLGQMILVPYTFCPRGWAEANGQLLSIAQNTALFSLLGTTYGGDGRRTFALPDLRGRAAAHLGGAIGSLGQRGGGAGAASNQGSLVALRYCIAITGIYPSRG